MLNFPTVKEALAKKEEEKSTIQAAVKQKRILGLFGSSSHHAFGFHSVMTRSHRKKGLFGGPSTISQGQHAVLVLGVVSHVHV